MTNTKNVQKEYANKPKRTKKQTNNYLYQSDGLLKHSKQKDLRTFLT